MLAGDWATYATQPLAQFSDRAGREVAEGRQWFEHAGDTVPDPARFSALLQSYATAAGMDLAIQRTARRLRRPEGLLGAAAAWQERIGALRADLAPLLADLGRLGNMNDSPCGPESTKV